MNILSLESGTARLELTEHELVIVNNALNETLNAIDDDEFDTRVGATTGEVDALLSAVRGALRSLSGTD